MEAAITTAAVYGLGAVGLAASAAGLKARLELSKAKHRSLGGHSRIARLVASLVPFYQYGEALIFKADGAPDAAVAQRRADFARLADLYRTRYAGTLRLTADATGLISDLQFTEAYRVPFQFSCHVRGHLPVGAFLQSSSGVTTSDLDGNAFYDLTGSYGVNLFGYDFYKECIDRGIERMRGLGSVLASYNPLVADNAARLVRLSGMDEVSLYMPKTRKIAGAGFAAPATGRTGRRRGLRSPCTLPRCSCRTPRDSPSSRSYGFAPISILMAVGPGRNSTGSAATSASAMRSCGVDRRNGRCGATNVNPATGERDLDLPGSLRATFGHKDLGVYLVVREGGRVVVGDALTVPDHTSAAAPPAAPPPLAGQRRFICRGCYYIYDEAIGAPEAGVAPETPFAEISIDWRCPDCGTDKGMFRLYVALSAGSPFVRSSDQSR